MLPVETYGVIWLAGVLRPDQLFENRIDLIITAAMPSAAWLIFPCRQHERDSPILYGRSIGARRSLFTVCCRAPQRRIVRLGIRQQVLHCNSGRRAVRPGRALAGRFSQHHLRPLGAQLTPPLSGHSYRSTGPPGLYRLRPRFKPGRPEGFPSTRSRFPKKNKLWAHIVQLLRRPRSQQGLLRSRRPAPLILPPVFGKQTGYEVLRGLGDLFFFSALRPGACSMSAAGKWPGPTPSPMLSGFANFPPCVPCALYAFDPLHFARWGRNARRCRKSPNPPCSIMPVTNWINNPNPRRKLIK